MTDVQSPDATVMVGSLVSSEQHVAMPGIVTQTRARALRAPWWAVVLIVQLASPLKPSQLLEFVVGFAAGG